MNPTEIEIALLAAEARGATSAEAHDAVIDALYLESRPEIAAVVAAAAAEQAFLERSRRERHEKARHGQTLLASLQARRRKLSRHQIEIENRAARRRLGIARDHRAVLRSLAATGTPSCAVRDDGTVTCSTSSEPEGRELSEQIQEAVSAAMAGREPAPAPTIEVKLPEQPAPEITVNIEIPERGPRRVRVEEDEEGNRSYRVEQESD